MIALVTGGSSGIGLEFSRQLAAKGYDILIVSNMHEQLENASAMIANDFNVKVITRYQNLAEEDSAEELYNWCIANEILPDILISNAGTFFFKELTPEIGERVDTMLKLHVTTPTKLCMLFGSEMKRRGRGRIMLVASLASQLPAPGITIYSASKAYLRSFGKSLSYEMKPYGVTVTTLCPAAIATTLYGLKSSLLRFGTAIHVIHTPEWLVRRALKGMFRGRRVMSPSLMRFWLPTLLKIVPDWLEEKLWMKYKDKL